MVPGRLEKFVVDICEEYSSLSQIILLGTAARRCFKSLANFSNLHRLKFELMQKSLMIWSLKTSVLCRCA